MLDNSLLEFFAHQSVQGKTQVLAQLSFELTIAARNTYVAGTETVKDPVRLRRFNEVQHQIAGYLCSMLNGIARYPDEVFVQMILEHEDTEVAKIFEHILSEAMHNLMPVALAT